MDVIQRTESPTLPVETTYTEWCVMLRDSISYDQKNSIQLAVVSCKFGILPFLVATQISFYIYKMDLRVSIGINGEMIMMKFFKNIKSITSWVLARFRAQPVISFIIVFAVLAVVVTLLLWAFGGFTKEVFSYLPD